MEADLAVLRQFPSTLDGAALYTDEEQGYTCRSRSAQYAGVGSPRAVSKCPFE